MYCPGIATVDSVTNNVGIRRSQLVGDLEAVDQCGVATGPVEVEAVQHLQARCVVAVRAVGVRRQVHVGVGQIGLGEVGGELPEPAEDRLAHVADATDEVLGGRRAWRVCP